MQARYQATLQPEQVKGHKAPCLRPRQVLFPPRQAANTLRGVYPDQSRRNHECTQMDPRAEDKSKGRRSSGLSPLGGQNLIEAAACGCPLVLGPHTFNFEDAALLAIEAGAAVRMNDLHHAVRRAVALASDPRRNDWVEAALAFAGSHRGATERMAKRIAMLLTGLDSV